MDFVSSCKAKLAYFRIKELKDVLAQLGLSKQGRKQDLMDRVLALLSDEEIFTTHCLGRKNSIGKEGVAKIIEDAYRKMQISDAADLATKACSGLDISIVKEEDTGFVSSKLKICCPCGELLPNKSIIQCVDPKCQLKQHISCVIIPEKPVEGKGNPAIPPLFYCEMCRIKRADPFWVTMVYLLLPVKLVASNIPLDGTNPLQSVERTFQLTREQQDLLQNSKYDVQAWCMLLNDSVLFRMQWLQHADLRVNGMLVRTVNRPGSQLLGANGRDDGALIKLFIREGINRISLSGSDSRIFCFGIRLVKRRSVEQVLNLIPKEKDGELFEEALARVCRCIGGGIGTMNDDSDSDLEVIADSITVNLRCPMSGTRMKIAGRFKRCVHMGCFDLETFIELNQRSRKWQCPICLKNYSLEDIIIDPYFNGIANMMRHCGEDITEIEVKPDGSWIAKPKGAIGDLRRWHLPDGSLCVATNEVTSHFDTLRQIEEGDSLNAHGTPEFGITKNLCGIVKVSKNQLISHSLRDQHNENVENHGQRIITSDGATGSGKDEEDQSINQDCGVTVDISPSSINEINSCHFFDATLGEKDLSSVPFENADIIILGDSDEENVDLVSLDTYYDNCKVNNSGSLAAHPGILDTYLEDATLDTGPSSCLGLFNANIGDAGMPNWLYPSVTDIQLFGADSDASDALIDLESSSITCSAPMNGYTLASASTVTSGGQVFDSSVCDTSIDIDVGLFDNPLAFAGKGSPLQTFLPSQHMQSNLRHQPPVSNGIPSEDWISLRLGSNSESLGSDFGPQAQSAVTKGINLRNHLGPSEGAFAAASVVALNDEARSNGKNNRKLSDGPFSFPRQPRSVRHRGHLSMGSD